MLFSQRILTLKSAAIVFSLPQLSKLEQKLNREKNVLDGLLVKKLEMSKPKSSVPDPAPELDSAESAWVAKLQSEVATKKWSRAQYKRITRRNRRAKAKAKAKADELAREQQDSDSLTDSDVTSESSDAAIVVTVPIPRDQLQQELSTLHTQLNNAKADLDHFLQITFSGDAEVGALENVAEGLNLREQTITDLQMKYDECLARIFNLGD